MTVAQAIRKALLSIGAVDAREHIDAQAYADGLVSLNAMLANWSAQRQTKYTSNLVTFALPNGTASHTIGTGGSINTSRPKEIVKAWISDANGIDYELQLFALENYADVPLKTTAGRPERLYFDRGYSLGTLYLYPVPDEGYTLNLRVIQPFTTYSAITADLGLPGEYEEAVIYNLAMRLSAENQLPIPQVVVELAKDGLSIIKRLNSNQIPGIESNPIGRRRFSYSIYEAD